MKKQLPFFYKTFTKQQDQSDCGVACLLSLIKFYGGEARLEGLRELSGTTTQGTTMLGLYQCANQTGFDVEGFEADLENLKQVKGPCILHVLIDNNLQHYVICYTFGPSGKFLIGDPAKGLLEMSDEELNAIWQSKTLLTLSPTEYFIKAKTIQHAKWSWFKNLLEEDYPVLIISIFIGIIIAVLGLSSAIFSQKLIDEILPKGNTDKLVIGLALLFLLLIIRSALNFLRQHFLLIQSRDFNTRITSNFYENLLNLPKSFFDHRKTGDMIARMNDTMRIQKSIAYIVGSFFIDLLVVTISAVYLFILSWQIACFALLSVPLMLLVVARFHKDIMNGQQLVMAAYAKTESNYVDTIQGIDTIKEANREPFFAKFTKSVYTFFQDKNFALGDTGNKFGLVTELVATVLIIGIIAASSFLVLGKQLTIGQMIAVLSIAGGLLPAVARLALTNLQIQEAKIAFDRMYEFVSIEPEYSTLKITETKPIEFKLLEVKHISFRFPGRKSVLKDISFIVKKGELIALLGESGCGKSTIIQLLQKFYQFESGKILVNSEDISALNTLLWRDVIATVPQEIKIFNTTVFENVTFGKDQSRDAFYTFCTHFGFDKYFLDLPQGYNTLIGEEGINLSGGQKQLVAIARALYKKPQLLLLDEATSAMDRNTERFILDLLQNLKDELAVILVTHRIHTAKIADRIYIIDEGIIENSGNSATLLLSENLYSQSLADYAK